MNISFKQDVRNSSEIKTPRISSESQAIVLIFLDVFIVIGNALTMLTVWRLRSRPLVVDVLIVALSLVDVFNALSSVTIAILMRFLILRGQSIPWMLCQVQGWCIVTFEMSSVFIISLVCFDRYTAIVKPFWHRIHLTCTRMVKAVVLVATFSTVAASLPLLGWDSYGPVDWLAMCLFNYRSSYAIFIAICGYIHLIFVLLSAIVIINSFGKFSKKRRKLTGRNSPGRHLVRHAVFVGTEQMRTNSERQHRQLARIGMVVVVFFYMSWLPLVLCITIQQVSGSDLSKMVLVASFLALSSPVVNPCIYFLMWKRYRKTFIQTLGILMRRHHPLLKRASSFGPRKNDQPRKGTRPIPLKALQISSTPNDGCSSPSFNFTDLGERRNSTDAKFDLTKRCLKCRRIGQIKCTFKEARDFRDVYSSEEAFVMHQLGTTNNANLKYTLSETYL